MTFEPQEVIAFTSLETAIGELDMNVMDVDENLSDTYVKNARSYAANALYYYSAWRLSLDPELMDKKNAIIAERMEAERLKAEARSHEKRENQVVGLLAGLSPRANRLPNALVTFETEEDVFHFSVFYNGTTRVILEYDRKTFLLNGILDGEKIEPEDWKKLNGNGSPMSQSPAYAAVVNYLDAHAESTGEA